MGGPGSGARKKPTALAILHGDDKKNPARVNRNEPKPMTGPIAPTAPLDIDGQGVWDRLAPDLIKQGVLTAWDADAFTLYCQTVSTYREAHASLEDEGLTARGAAGGVIKSPYWQIMRDAATLMLQYGSRFGLTPADRAKLSVGEPEKVPGEDYLTG